MPSSTATDQYFGLYRVLLSPVLWDLDHQSRPWGAPEYNLYRDMREYLRHNKITHRFEWYNSGFFLPSSVWVEPDAATFFKLKYNI